MESLYTLGEEADASLRRVEAALEDDRCRGQRRVEFEKLRAQLREHQIQILRARNRQLEKRCAELSWKLGEVPYLPAGEHPSCSVDGVGFHLLICRGSEAAMEVQRLAIIEKSLVPYFDADHQDRAVLFFPKEFIWRDGARPGVYARGEWSAEGRRAVVQSKRYWSFSPWLAIDSNYVPCVVASSGVVAGPNMGGFVSLGRTPLYKGLILHGL